MDRSVLWSRSFVLAVSATAVVFYGFYFLIPTLPAYAARLGATRSEIGLLVGIYSVSAVVIRLLTGAGMDRCGRKPFLLGGLALFAGMVALYPVAGSVRALAALRVLHGFGWGWALTAVGALVADLAPPLRRGEAVGFWGLAPTLAMAVGPWTGAALLEARGFAVVFGATAALGLLAALLALPIREPAASRPLRPQSLLPPRGAILPSAVVYLSSLSYGALIAFLPLELADAPGQAGSFFTLYALTILVARPIAGRLSDRWGRPRLIHPGLTLGAAGTAVLGWAPSPLALGAAAVLYGVGISGASFPGLMALTVDRCPEGSRGAGLSAFFSAYDLAIASGAALLGPAYQCFGFRPMMLLAAAGVVCAQALFATALRRDRRRA